MSKLRHALKETVKLPLGNPNLILSIIFFLLFPFNLILLAVQILDLHPLFALKRGNKVILEFVFVRDILQWLVGTLAVSIISKAYIEKPSSILQLLSSFQRQSVKIFVTSVFAELAAFNCKSLLLVLGYPTKDTNLLAFITSVIGFCIFMFVHLACHLSLVVSSVEENSYGLLAIQRASIYTFCR